MATNSMRALVVTDFGGAASVRMTELSVPTPGPREVLIRNGGGALNFLDLLMVEGRY